MELAKLWIALAADAAEYAKQLDETSRDSVAWANDMGSQMGAALKTAIAGALIAVAIAIAGVGLAAFGMSNDIHNAALDIQSELGVTADEATRLADVAAQVWGNNFAGSIEEAADAVTIVRQQLGALSDDEMQRVTEDAFRLRDAFGVEVTDSVDAAKTLMEQFGLTSDEAFDFIASGFQRGLDRSGDFLDSIGEYSTQFSSGGADAGQFFSLLESGLQGGMLGTDKAADAFKEFRVRIQDGSTLTAESLEALGINSQELFEGMRDGTVTAADAFMLVTDALAETDDTALQMQAGVGLLGTQFEDLGTEGVLALSLIGTEMDDLAGATANIDTRYGSLGDVVEGFKRRGLLALRPIGDLMLDLANRVMPLVDEGFAFFETSIVPAIETAAGVVESFIRNFEEGMSPIDAFIEAIWDIAPPALLEALVDFRDNIMPGVSAAVAAVVEPVSAWVGNNFQLSDVLAALGVVVASIVIPAVLSLIAAIAPVIVAFGLVVAAVALVRTAWEQNFGGIQEKTAAVLAFVQNLITTVITAVQVFWAENGDAILAKAQQTWQGILDFITMALNFIWNGVILPIVAGIQAFWAEHGDAISAKAQETWGLILAFIQAAITLIGNIITTVVTAVQTFWLAHGETISASAKKVWDFIAQTIQDVLTVINGVLKVFVDLFKGDWEALGEDLGELWEASWTLIVNFLTGLWDMVQPILASFWGSIQTWWGGIDWAGLGNDIINGIVAGLQAAGGAISAYLNGLVQEAIAKLKALLGITSPSRVMASMIGRPMGQGIIVGMDEMNDPIRRAAERMGGVAIEGGQASMTDNRQYHTTVQSNRDPMQLVRASRYLDKLGAAGLA